MAPLEQYLMPKAEEIALARSAAPSAISDNAEIRVLTRNGYEVAAKGTNGFVCLVERGWTAGFSDKVFWNPRIRGPICFNPEAVASVLPAHIERTTWVLAGVSREEMERRTPGSAANTPPAAGAMSYMLSRQQYLSDDGGHHWHPHLMFWVPRTPSSDWGANLPGSPVAGGGTEIGPVTTFFVPVGKWSDGSPADMEH
ncbi:MAG: hypothetical protein ISS15_16555 [Alphaproteobacteria bacterium]|nr:hypothetical protein [Alphaproteobacteria bacterium]MBL7099271.1 hypothetical protein [Alphaproteobacteria bacterium]